VVDGLGWQESSEGLAQLRRLWAGVQGAEGGEDMFGAVSFAGMEEEEEVMKCKRESW
jgi:hypothetical protein